MAVVLTAAYVVHVASAALWTGATLYFVGYIAPSAGEGDGGAFYAAVDGLLRVTRWTGIALPVTGGYLVWRRYTLDALFGTPRGWLVVAMAVLWIVMNGVMELGTLRMRERMGEVDMENYFSEGFPRSADDGVTPAEVAASGRRHMLAAAGLAVLLLADAAVLATGIV